MSVSMYQRAGKFLNIAELAGNRDHPLIQWWLSLCGLSTDTPDEVSWCSAAMNGVAWDEDLPRSHSAAARSWLAIGTPVLLADARPCENDIAILWRGSPDGWQGHVAIYCGSHGDNLLLRGGNQGDKFCDALYPASHLIGIRRLA